MQQASKPGSTKSEFQAAALDLVRERAEADEAIAFSSNELALWTAANRKALAQQAHLEAHQLARKFTDAHVSIKERFRALSKSNDPAPLFRIEVVEGKGQGCKGSQQNLEQDGVRQDGVRKREK